MGLAFFCNKCCEPITDFNHIKYIQQGITISEMTVRCLCRNCKEKYEVTHDKDLVIIEVIDPNTQTPPFNFIEIDYFTENVPRGEEDARRFLLGQCFRMGYAFKEFLKVGNIYTVTVQNRNSPGSGAYQFNHIKGI
jgi:hypothetical protein